MKTIEIRCDGCGAEVATTGNMVDYRLALIVENLQPVGQVLTVMSVLRPLDRDHHFCGIQCLDHWRNRGRHAEALSKDWWKSWKRENGSVSNGIQSYINPPVETVSAAEEEFKAAALAAFPMRNAQS